MNYVAEILGTGITGIGFYIARYAYRLLVKELGEKTIRPPAVRAIYTYMAFCIVIIFVGAFVILFPIIVRVHKDERIDFFCQYLSRTDNLAQPSNAWLRKELLKQLCTGTNPQ